MKSSASLAICCAIFIAAMASELSADTRQSSYQVPSNAQVIEYLLQSVNWYRHGYAERQVASDPTDLPFLHEHEASEEQIVKLSFEFAKADVALATAASSPQNAPATPASADPPPSDLAHFIELKNRNDRESQKAIEDIKSLNEKTASAPNADRKKLKAALDDAQSRLVLMQAVSQTVNNLIEFVQSVGTSKAHTGDLDSTINDLAQSMPELNKPFGVTSDFRSLATYFGFLTAGVAVALQNVIVASLGYLLLTGKRGIRIGDRVQVSAVTGDVIDIGLLQFQLREFDVQKQQFTGHVATFSN